MTHPRSLMAALPLLLTLGLTGCDALTQSGDDLVASASANMLEGNHQKAEEAFRKALELPLTRFSKPQVLTLMGNNFVGRGMYDSAVVYHHKALELDPGYAEAWVNLGVAERRQKHNPEAEAAYQKAMALTPDDPVLLMNLGALLVDNGKPEEAKAHLTKAVSLDSSLVVAHVTLATALAMLGDTTGADAQVARAKALKYEFLENIEAYVQRQKDSLKAKAAL